MSNYEFKRADPELVEKILKAVAFGGDGCPGTCSLADQLRNQCCVQTLAEAESELVKVCLRLDPHMGVDIRGAMAQAIRKATEAVREARAAEQKEEQEK